MQREASGLTVDAGGLAKRWTVRFLVKLPGSFPPQCRLQSGGTPNALPLRGEAPWAVLIWTLCSSLR